MKTSQPSDRMVTAPCQNPFASRLTRHALRVATDRTRAQRSLSGRDGQMCQRATKETSMRFRHRAQSIGCIALALWGLSAGSLWAQAVTFSPYIQAGDNGSFGPKDQMIVTWQTDESHPAPAAYAVEFGESHSRLKSAPISARVVDNYLSADPQFSALVLPFRYGAHSNYT